MSLYLIDPIIANHIHDRPGMIQFIAKYFIPIHEKFLPDIKKQMLKTIKTKSKQLRESKTKYGKISTEAPKFFGNEDPQTQLNRILTYISRKEVYDKLQAFNELMKSPNVTVKLGDSKPIEYAYTYSDLMDAIKTDGSGAVRSESILSPDGIGLINKQNNPFYARMVYTRTPSTFDMMMRTEFMKDDIRRTMINAQQYIDKNNRILTDLEESGNSDRIGSLVSNQRYLDNVYDMLKSYYLLHEAKLNATYASKSVRTSFGVNTNVVDVSRDFIENNFFDVMIQDANRKIDEGKYNWKQLTSKNIRKLKIITPLLTVGFQPESGVTAPAKQTVIRRGAKKATRAKRKPSSPKKRT